MNRILNFERNFNIPEAPKANLYRFAKRLGLHDLYQVPKVMRCFMNGNWWPIRPSVGPLRKAIVLHDNENIQLSFQKAFSAALKSEAKKIWKMCNTIQKEKYTLLSSLLYIWVFRLHA